MFIIVLLFSVAVETIWEIGWGWGGVRESMQTYSNQSLCLCLGPIFFEHITDIILAVVHTTFWGVYTLLLVFYVHHIIYTLHILHCICYLVYIYYIYKSEFTKLNYLVYMRSVYREPESGGLLGEGCRLLWVYIAIAQRSNHISTQKKNRKNQKHNWLWKLTRQT